LSLSAILLVFLSALCHSAWNLLAKSSGGPIAFMRQALRFSALCYAPVFLVFLFLVDYSPVYLACIIGSGLAVGLFLFCLSKSYQYGQVSVAYPIARSFPILVVTWVLFLWGVTPSAVGLAGILLIVCGCFVLPMARFTLGPDGFSPGNYLNRSCLWALLAALATSIFAVIDKYAAVHMPTIPIDLAIYSRINYVYLQNLVALLVMELCTLRLKQPYPKAHRYRALFAGVIFLISYSLIIMALTSDPVSYVVSFRQVSILITALVSMTWIEREVSAPRLVGVGTIFIGVVLVGLA
jgi:drug/metabolite transporter (DMT)-like permease